jgi:hypothetical protein
MKSKLLFIAFLICLETSAQVTGCFEQIYYFDEGNAFSMGPLAQLQHASSLYAEVRYNYEEARTVSVYLGKSFLRDGDFSYALTPMFGGVLGKFNGWSAGLNSDVGYKNFYFSAQSQYTFSAEDEINNFYFSWAELGYQPLDWMYGGLAIQETYMPQTKENLTHPGFVVGFTYKKWTMPLYGFKTGKDMQAFVCSLIFEW